MKNAIKLGMVMASMALFACDKPQDSKPAEPAAPTAATAANTATNTNANTTGATQAKTAEPVTIAESDLASPADFESEAETTITSKNYKAEIASLEAEIGKE